VKPSKGSIVAQPGRRSTLPCFAAFGTLSKFDAALASAVRLRNPVVAEGLVFVFVFAVGGVYFRSNYVNVDTTTCIAHLSGDGVKFSYAGMWYVYASIPIFQFLLLR